MILNAKNVGFKAVIKVLIYVLQNMFLYYQADCIMRIKYKYF